MSGLCQGFPTLWGNKGNMKHENLLTDVRLVVKAQISALCLRKIGADIVHLGAKTYVFQNSIRKITKISF